MEVGAVRLVKLDVKAWPEHIGHDRILEQRDDSDDQRHDADQLFQLPPAHACLSVA